MRLKPGKTYIKKERTYSFLVTIISLLIVGVIIATISLLPGRSSQLGYSEQNGVGRSFMYPFVYTDVNNSLYILDDENIVRMIDNDTSKAVHDSTNRLVYYVKNGELYEYDIETNERIFLCNNVEEFSLFGNRRCITIRDLSNRIKLYMFQEKNTKLLCDGKNEYYGYAVGDEGVVYINGTKLQYCDFNGNVNTISNNVNVSKPFYISNRELICYHENDNMIISTKRGRILQKSKNSEPILFNDSTMIVQPVTNESDGKHEVPFRYFLTDITDISKSGEDMQYNVGNLKYFNGKNFKNIDEKVYQVIHYSEEDNFVIYSKLNGEHINIYMSEKGKKVQKQITCQKNSKFLFDNRSNYLYVNTNGVLSRYNIYDVNYEIIKIAENVENMYDYKNKPFVAYTDEKQMYYYLVTNDKVEKIKMNQDLRLYGKSYDSYFLGSLKGNGLMTLDYVEDGRMTRIADNVGSNVFFDKNLEFIIYNCNEGMYLWSHKESIFIGKYDGVKAVNII